MIYKLGPRGGDGGTFHKPSDPLWRGKPEEVEGRGEASEKYSHGTAETVNLWD
jgi:hypothetical protein